MKRNLLQRILDIQPTNSGAEVAVQFQPPAPEVMEKVLLTGDLAALSASQRLGYYESVCRALKLNPLTKPFEYIVLNGKLTLYARKDCTEQLRRTYGISLKIVTRGLVDGVFTVVARAEMPNGRQDESVGAVFLPPAGEAKSNAMMKAETKAKRRVTLSICGLGMFDESEMDSMPSEINDAQSRVERATANRIAIQEGVKEISGPITAENFAEVVCHIGKAEGDMLGKKVGEIHPKVLKWLRNHFGDGEGIRWGNPPNEKDARLMSAVTLALEKL